ncbi:MAG: hypothetical protein KatS3mg060_0564 [Dehalococcoidia bacterium]|nr:MAG: hypothetical protein KatS3mg060_0564 [Dehalococcoidia bacterium]
MTTAGRAATPPATVVGRPTAARPTRWLPLPALALAVALAVRPLGLVSFPATHDGLNHLQRQVVFDSLLRGGMLYPRWYPDFASGYGYPLGNFYPPLALYIAELTLVAGAGPALALKFAFALALGLAAGGAYCFVRRVVGTAAAGVLGGAAYLAAPYLLATVYDRGALPEALALGLLPWSLWALDRWRGGRAGLPLVALLLAALVATHTIVAAMGWGLGAIWWAANRRGPLRWLPLPFLAAAGLSAFVWLPALVEAPAAALDNFARLGSAAANVVPLPALIDGALLYDYRALPYRLGLVQAVLAVAGLAVSLRSPASRSAVTAFLLFGGCAVAATTLAGGLWTQPALQVVQFPWRLLGPAALFAALLAGLLAGGRHGPVVATAGAAIVLLGGLGALQPVDRDVDDRVLSVGSAVRREWTEGTIGTTTAAEYLPAVARGGYAPGPLPAAISRDAPPLRSARLESWTPLGWRIAVVADEPTVLRVHQFLFPGWSAWLDGAPVPVAADGPLGLVAVAVPTGEHLVEVRFATTPARSAGALLSALSAIALGWLVTPAVAVGAAALGLVLGMALSTLPVPRNSTLAPADLGGVRLLGGTTELREGRVTATLVWLGTRPGGERITVRLREEDGGLLAESTAFPIWNTATRWSANEVVAERRELALPAGPPGRAAVEVEAAGRRERVGTVTLPGRRERALAHLANRIEERFGGQLALTGWEVAGLDRDGALVPGGAIDLALEWTALRSVEEDYTVFVHVIGPDGRRYGQSDSQPAAGLAPTTLLLPGEPLIDRRRVALAADAPPGRYQLDVGLYRLATGERLPVGSGTVVSLGPFKVPSVPATVPPVDSIDAQFGSIVLAGGRVEGGALTLIWRAVERPPADLRVAVHLLDGAGQLVAQADGPPDGGRYPTSLWSPGETIVDRRSLPAVPALRVAVWLYDPLSGARLGEPVVLPIPSA